MEVGPAGGERTLPQPVGAHPRNNPSRWRRQLAGRDTLSEGMGPQVDQSGAGEAARLWRRSCRADSPSRSRLRRSVALHSTRPRNSPSVMPGRRERRPIPPVVPFRPPAGEAAWPEESSRSAGERTMATSIASSARVAPFAHIAHTGLTSSLAPNRRPWSSKRTSPANGLYPPVGSPSQVTVNSGRRRPVHG